MNPITTSDGLEQVCQLFSKSEFITVDTEFIRETTYWPELCLIQMANGDETVLIDPLAKGMDLSPFFALMAQPSVTKVFHAARQDIEIIYNLGGVIPTPLFDTQVAAMVCGFGEQISYDQLVGRLTDIKIDKSSRFTDWRRRPLTDKQMNYAAADVIHLVDVYKQLVDQLSQSGRRDWVAEEMQFLADPSTYQNPPETAWVRLKPRTRKPRELALIQALAAWREQTAQEKNQPRGRVLKDDALREIATQHPKTVNALKQLRGLSKGWEKSAHAQAVIDIVLTVDEIPKQELPEIPKQPHINKGSSAAGELLRVLLKMTAEREGVASKLIATSADLDALASEGDAAEIDALHGWRYEIFGKIALELLTGRLAISFQDRRLALMEL